MSFSRIGWGQPPSLSLHAAPKIGFEVLVKFFGANPDKRAAGEKRGEDSSMSTSDGTLDSDLRLQREWRTLCQPTQWNYVLELEGSFFV